MRDYKLDVLAIAKRLESQMVKLPRIHTNDHIMLCHVNGMEFQKRWKYTSKEEEAAYHLVAKSGQHLHCFSERTPEKFVNWRSIFAKLTHEMKDWARASDFYTKGATMRTNARKSRPAHLTSKIKLPRQ